MIIEKIRSSLCAGILLAFLTPILAWGNADSLALLTLPKPQLDKGRPFMKALSERKSTREYSTQQLSLQDLSNLLWAGFGINRPETGGRTAPSAMNTQEIDLYVALAAGVYKYDAKANVLKPVTAKDVRGLTGKQEFVKNAPANILLVADYGRIKRGNMTPEIKRQYACTNAGFICQNMYLYCASEGLATVVRAGMDKDALRPVLNLTPDQEIILAQTVGYPKK